ncbi:hypothetical protein [Prevotella intermedia]|uniref:hypothetical protein n=1 Tax=Prevotella intermedia TaxID=28131 RepID=UPI001185DCB3|nr:hypothetical protein [Prevotella intermedia]
MAWYEDLYIIVEGNNAILQYCYIDIMLSLYNVYNDSIIYNYGILYILQAALLSALCSECCCQLFCTPDVPEAAANSIFPLSLAFILASGIDKSCLHCGYLLSKMCTAMQARALIPAMCSLQEAWVW